MTALLLICCLQFAATLYAFAGWHRALTAWQRSSDRWHDTWKRSHEGWKVAQDGWRDALVGYQEAVTVLVEMGEREAARHEFAVDTSLPEMSRRGEEKPS